jgi:predicted metal-dependent phosphotriesterase family hydrolase
MNRREFLIAAAGGAAARPAAAPARIWTVEGPASPAALGATLIHEHVLVDFIGADRITPGRYDRREVFRTALPRLAAARRAGCRTLVECTPAYLGRDPALLAQLARAAKLRIITNTGYYGAGRDKFVPPHAWSETSGEIAARWTREFRDGIGTTGIRPGFIKTGVDSGKLSEIDRKLITAAGLCHQQTGLRIHAHTGDGAAALDIVETLRSMKIDPRAYVWVHAQNEKDRDIHRRAAEAGAWLEFDGISSTALDAHVDAIVEMARAGFLDQLLVSQDSGWYHVGEPAGGDFKGYTYLFDAFLPALRKRGFTEAQIKRLMVDNPARALTPSAVQDVRGVVK